MKNTNYKSLQLFLALIATLIFAISFSAQTVNGCADKNTGSLRRIVPPAVCKSSEMAVNWSVQGPQGIQGPQGVPGTSPSRLITIATGLGDIELMPCSEAIRSKDFVKQSSTSKLRITYHDQTFVQSPTNIAAFDIQVKIDGAAVAPTPLEHYFDGGHFVAGDEFTAFGYAYDIPAGNHTLTTFYNFTILPPLACLRTSRYIIEIEEIP